MRKRQETLRVYDSMRRTTCCNCPTGCGMKVFLKGDAVVDIFGDEEHPVNKGSLCPKGLLACRHLENPERIVYPRIRENLGQPFRRAAWEEAITFASRRLKEISEKYGKDSLCVYGDWSDPFEYLAQGDLFARRLGTENGPYRFLPFPFGPEGGIKGMFGVPASQLSMNTMRDWSNSKCIVIYRSDLAASDPVTFGHILDARDRGTTLVVIDSRGTITSSKATLSLRANPGTERLVLKGILHLLIRKGLVDEGFLDESFPDYSSFAPELEGFTAEEVSRCSGIKKTDLERAVDLIGRAKPIQVIAADWNSRRYLSDEELFFCGALVCLRGSIGIPGGGLNLMDVSPFPAESSYKGEENAPLTGQSAPSSLSLENLLPDPGKVGALIWIGNPCARMANGKATKKALGEVPFILHLSSYPNETFHCCHVSFPMSSWLEYSGLVANNNGRAVQWHHKIVQPPGECRSPLEFWNELAHACGAGGDLSLRRGPEAEAEIADRFLKQNPLTRSISVGKIDPEKNPPGGVLWPCVAEGDLEFENSRFIKGDIRGRNILFQRGNRYPLSDKRFPTPTEKISFIVRGRDGEDTDGVISKASQLSFPQAERVGNPSEDEERFQTSRNDRPPAVSGFNNDRLSRSQKTALCPELAPDDLFPMTLITGLLVDFIEEYGYFVSDRAERTTPLAVKLHPQTGKLLGVKNGEDITVENERGSFTAPAWLSEDVAQGVVWCPEGIDPYQPHFHYGSPRALFKTAAPHSEAQSFTRVIVYKPGNDRIRAAKKLSVFLAGLGGKVEP